MQKTKGFTLIEVLIVVVVIAVLAAIAFPAYQDSVRKSRRTEAQSVLLQAAQILERCFTEFNSYTNSSCELIDGSNAFIDSNSDDTPFDGEGYYAITDTVLTATTFTLQATARSEGGQDQDTQCASFELDQAGKKESNGAGDDTADCW